MQCLLGLFLVQQILRVASSRQMCLGREKNWVFLTTGRETTRNALQHLGILICKLRIKISKWGKMGRMGSLQLSTRYSQQFKYNS